MLIPVTRAPSMLARTFIDSLAPAVTSLCSHLPALTKPVKIEGFNNAPDTNQTPSPSILSCTASTVQSPSHASPSRFVPAMPRTFGLIGMRNTSDIVGSSVLRHMITRGFSGGSTSSAPADPRDKLIRTSQKLSYSVKKIDQYYFLELGSSWTTRSDYVMLVLSDDEISNALSDPTFLDRMVRKIRGAPEDYLNRCVKNWNRVENWSRKFK